MVDAPRRTPSVVAPLRNRRQRIVNALAVGPDPVIDVVGIGAATGHRSPAGPPGESARSGYRAAAAAIGAPGRDAARCRCPTPVLVPGPGRDASQAAGDPGGGVLMAVDAPFSVAGDWSDRGLTHHRLARTDARDDALDLAESCLYAALAALAAARTVPDNAARGHVATATALIETAGVTLAAWGTTSRATTPRATRPASAPAPGIGGAEHVAMGTESTVNGAHVTLAGDRAVAPNARPAGLSARESEVLALLVEGLTNREIGSRLGIAEKTVTNHLTHVFTKTNLGNRTAAVAFALRQGLA